MSAKTALAGMAAILLATGGTLPPLPGGARANRIPPEGWPCPKNPDHGSTRRRYCPVCRARVEPKPDEGV